MNFQYVSTCMSVLRKKFSNNIFIFTQCTYGYTLMDKIIGVRLAGTVLANARVNVTIFAIPLRFYNEGERGSETNCRTIVLILSLSDKVSLPQSFIQQKLE